MGTAECLARGTNRSRRRRRGELRAGGDTDRRPLLQRRPATSSCRGEFVPCGDHWIGPMPQSRRRPVPGAPLNTASPTARRAEPPQASRHSVAPPTSGASQDGSRDGSRDGSQTCIDSPRGKDRATRCGTWCCPQEWRWWRETAAARLAGTKRCLSSIARQHRHGPCRRPDRQASISASTAAADCFCPALETLDRCLSAICARSASRSASTSTPVRGSSDAVRNSRFAEGLRVARRVPLANWRSRPRRWRYRPAAPSTQRLSPSSDPRRARPDPARCRGPLLRRPRRSSRPPAAPPARCRSRSSRRAA
jgi:hypothetical protein